MLSLLLFLPLVEGDVGFDQQEESICEEPRFEETDATFDVERAQAIDMYPDERSLLAETLAFARQLFVVLPHRRANTSAVEFTRLLWRSSRAFTATLASRYVELNEDGSPRTRLTVIVDTDFAGTVPSGATTDIIVNGDITSRRGLARRPYALREGAPSLFLLSDNQSDALIAAFPVHEGGTVDVLGASLLDSDIAFVFESFVAARGGIQ